MKVVISGTAAARPLDSDEEITDPARLKKLDGLDYSTDRCAKYLDRSLEAIGITGGTIRLGWDASSRQLRVITEYATARKLTPAELKKLVSDTVGQWSDGVGEGDFRHRRKLKMEVDLSPSGAKKPKVEQIDDGKKVKKPPARELINALIDGNRKSAKRLIEEGADLSSKDASGDTPLHWACGKGEYELALFMLERGADPRATTRKKETVLASLAMSEVSKARRTLSVTVARALLAAKVPPDGPDSLGVTPLMWAANRGNVPLVEFLIENGANVKAKDREKYNESTVLMYAQHVDVAEILLKHGADPSVTNAQDETAWDVARINSHWSASKRLARMYRDHAERAAK